MVLHHFLCLSFTMDSFVHFLYLFFITWAWLGNVYWFKIDEVDARAMSTQVEVDVMNKEQPSIGFGEKEGLSFLLKQWLILIAYLWFCCLSQRLDLPIAWYTFLCQPKAPCQRRATSEVPSLYDTLLIFLWDYYIIDIFMTTKEYMFLTLNTKDVIKKRNSFNYTFYYFWTISAIIVLPQTTLISVK